MEEQQITQQKFKKREIKISSIYSRGLISRNIMLPITCIGNNIKETIEENIKQNFEGKCVVEGYIKENSSKLISYSSGIVKRGIYASFEVIFECQICFPVEGMLINCIVKNITKAGIRAESLNEIPSPIIVFVAKDHHYNNSLFSDIKEDDKINVRVIGQRFELNDKYISIIGELVKPKKNFTKKPRIVIED